MRTARQDRKMEMMNTTGRPKLRIASTATSKRMEYEVAQRQLLSTA